MNDQRRAEYHRTIDMLRRCAARQGETDPEVPMTRIPPIPESVLVDIISQWPTTTKLTSGNNGEKVYMITIVGVSA